MIKFFPALELQNLPDLQSYWCAQLADLHRLCFEKSWDAADFFALSQRPTALWGLIFTAKDKNQLIGMIVVDDLAPEAEILTLAIHPNHQQKGQGRQLLSQFIKEYPRERYFLEVENDNVAALRLYTTSNFLRIAERKGYYQHQEQEKNAILMIFQNKKG